MITQEDIEYASQRIAPYVRKTPVITLEAGVWGIPGRIALKLEQLQHTGSFKVRGAFNRLLTQSIPSTGVIAASGGNHGVAVAYVARQLGYHAEIFVPEIAALVKVERLRLYGAQVNIVGANYGEALKASEQRASATEALVVHAYDQLEVVMGQGTLGYELAQQLPELDTVLVAVGGGGLISGIASWFGGSLRIIGVESEQTASMSEALRVGRPVDVEVGGIAADALGAKRVGQIAFSIAKRYVEQIILVSDDAIRTAQRHLWDDLRIVAEPAGAVAIAALIEGLYRPAPDENVGIIICGGNASLTQML